MLCECVCTSVSVCAWVGELFLETILVLYSGCFLRKKFLVLQKLRTGVLHTKFVSDYSRGH